MCQFLEGIFPRTGEQFVPGISKIGILLGLLDNFRNFAVEVAERLFLFIGVFSLCEPLLWGDVASASLLIVLITKRGGRGLDWLHPAVAFLKTGPGHFNFLVDEVDDVTAESAFLDEILGEAIVVVVLVEIDGAGALGVDFYLDDGWIGGGVPMSAPRLLNLLSLVSIR